MKKLLMALLSIAMLITVWGCGKKDETLIQNAVTEYINEILTDPMSLVSGKNEIIAKNGEDAEMWPILNEILKQTSYEITKTTIDGNNAEVELNFTSFDMGKGYEDMIDLYVDAVLNAYIESGSMEGIDTVKLLIENWKLAIDQQKEAGKTRVTPYTMKLTKTDSGWNIEDCKSAEDFLDIIAGGIFSAVEKVNS
ncbi:MAG: hypothetical protein IJL94_02185 [Erysipelotrichaceae bacterium]|nr:hypothetical protein [Erysipelotrichaceae bacterium]